MRKKPVQKPAGPPGATGPLPVKPRTKPNTGALKQQKRRKRKAAKQARKRNRGR